MCPDRSIAGLPNLRCSVITRLMARPRQVLQHRSSRHWLRAGLGPFTGPVTAMLVAGGLAFAFGSALVILLRSVAQPALALSLGLAMLVLTAEAMRPATMLAMPPIE